MTHTTERVIPTPEPTYKIVRFYQSDDYDTEVVKRGLSLEAAHAWCNDPETSSSTCTLAEGLDRLRKRGPWFDGWTEDDDQPCAVCRGTADEMRDGRWYCDGHLDVPEDMVRVSVQYAADEDEGNLVWRGQILDLPSWCSGDPAHAAALYLWGYAGAAEANHVTAEVL